MLVSELMSAPVVTTPVDGALDEAVSLMLDRSVGSVIVMDGTVPVGIVTNADVLSIGHERDVGFTDITIREAMSEQLITVEPDTTVRQAVETMNDHGIKKLPVVEDFEVVGVLTMSDVVGAYLSLLSEAQYEVDRRRDWSADD